MPDYFRSIAIRTAVKRAGQVLTNKIHNESSDVSWGIGCFEGMFSLQSMLASGHTRHSPGGSICTVGTPAGDARKTTKSTNISPLGVYETSEWCKSFVLIPKANG